MEKITYVGEKFQGKTRENMIRVEEYIRANLRVNCNSYQERKQFLDDMNRVLDYYVKKNRNDEMIKRNDLLNDNNIEMDNRICVATNDKKK